MRYAFLFVVLAGCGGGSGGKSFTWVTQANPNPFHQSGCRVSVDPVTFDKLIYAGEPEATQLANMPPDQQARFQDDKKAFSFGLKQELVATHANIILDGPAQGPNQYLMKIALVGYSPGGDAELVVDVTDGAGTQVLDEIRVASSAVSLREATGPLGQKLAKYLKTRFCSH